MTRKAPMNAELAQVTTTLLILLTIGTVYWRLDIAFARRMRRPDRSVKLPAATVARDMAPRISPLMKVGTKISIIGYDGSYAKYDNGKYWVDALNSWLKSGAAVNYILLNPDKFALTTLGSIQKKFPKQMHIKIVEFNRTKKTKQAAALIKSFETFHPTLIQGPNFRAMWIEHFHPIGGRVAFNVEYVSPNDAKSDIRFGKFEKYHQALNNISQTYETMAA